MERGREKLEECFQSYFEWPAVHSGPQRRALLWTVNDFGSLPCCCGRGCVENYLPRSKDQIMATVDTKVTCSLSGDRLRVENCLWEGAEGSSAARQGGTPSPCSVGRRSVSAPGRNRTGFHVRLAHRNIKERVVSVSKPRAQITVSGGQACNPLYCVWNAIRTVYPAFQMVVATMATELGVPKAKPEAREWLNASSLDDGARFWATGSSNNHVAITQYGEEDRPYHGTARLPGRAGYSFIAGTTVLPRDVPNSR